MSDTSGIKRLYKSRTERMIDGVCGGVAKYFNLDPTLVRIAWVVLTLLGGSGIILYFIGMIVMPKEPYVMPNFQSQNPTSDPNAPSTTASTATTPNEPSKKNSLFWGILLIAVGLVLFLDNVGIDFWRHWWWFDGSFVLSVILILVGVAFLWGGRNGLSKSSTTSEASTMNEMNADQLSTQQSSPKRLHRSFSDSKLFGVCGGLGEYFGIDSTIVRVLLIAGALASGGAVVIGYIIMAIVLPKEIPTFKTI